VIDVLVGTSPLVMVYILHAPPYVIYSIIYLITHSLKDKKGCMKETFVSHLLKEMGTHAVSTKDFL